MCLYEFNRNCAKGFDDVQFKNADELKNKGFLLKGNIFVKEKQQFLPLYEGKMIWLYNHRASSVNYCGDIVAGRHDTIQSTEADLKNPDYCVQPRVWINKQNVIEKLEFETKYLFGFRAIADSNNERTGIFSFIPIAGCGNSMPIIIFDSKEDIFLFTANVSSLLFDYSLRCKVGGNNINLYVVKQLPILSRKDYVDWEKKFINNRVIELIKTSYELDLSEIIGQAQPPFIWDNNRRFIIQCELDAYYFYKYEISKQDVEYILSRFPLIKSRDEEKYGKYRTKQVILEIYDEITEAMRIGKPYQTRLDPPPADPRVAHK